MTGVVERVTLTHLQIPLKEPFRIAGGEVAVKDAILVTVETGDGVGLGESSPMAAGFGYSDDTPEGCWDDLAERIAPSLLGCAFATVDDIAEQAGTWRGSRFAIAGAETACWDLLGQARHATVAELLGGLGSTRSIARSRRAWPSGCTRRSSSCSRRSRPTSTPAIAASRSRSAPARTSSSSAPSGSTSATSR